VVFRALPGASWGFLPPPRHRLSGALLEATPPAPPFHPSPIGSHELFVGCFVAFVLPARPLACSPARPPARPPARTHAASPPPSCRPARLCLCPPEYTGPTS